MSVASDTSQRDRVAPEALTRLLDDDHAELRASLPTAGLRARVYEWARSLAAEGQLGTDPDAVLGAPIGWRDAADH